MSPQRPHTGRRRNPAAREAILVSVTELLAESGGVHATMDQIAAAAGVSKQTIYRWWPSKGAVLLDAMAEWARTRAPEPDTGRVLDDLATFLGSTFAAVSGPPAAPLLRAILAEAQHDSQTADLLTEFARDRRATLHRILERGQARGELPDADLELLVEQAYGLLWYRLAVSRDPLTTDVAVRLAAALCR
ncbi:TetR/AcrR family transcriptional regulator [Nocardia uniformis]|nr:TetR/AcrR family transcriptional regulator [Nocardia uniformis]